MTSRSWSSIRSSRERAARRSTRSRASSRSNAAANRGSSPYSATSGSRSSVKKRSKRTANASSPVSDRPAPRRSPRAPPRASRGRSARLAEAEIRGGAQSRSSLRIWWVIVSFSAPRSGTSPRSASRSAISSRPVEGLQQQEAQHRDPQVALGLGAAAAEAGLAQDLEDRLVLLGEPEVGGVAAGEQLAAVEGGAVGPGLDEVRELGVAPLVGELDPRALLGRERDALVEDALVAPSAAGRASCSSRSAPSLVRTSVTRALMSFSFSARATETRWWPSRTKCRSPMR